MKNKGQEGQAVPQVTVSPAVGSEWGESTSIEQSTHSLDGKAIEEEMINECLFLPESSEHCPISQNKHKLKMKLSSIPVLLRQSSNYCFIFFSKNRKHKIN